MALVDGLVEQVLDVAGDLRVVLQVGVLGVVQDLFAGGVDLSLGVGDGAKGASHRSHSSCQISRSPCQYRFRVTEFTTSPKSW